MNRLLVGITAALTLTASLGCAAASYSLAEPSDYDYAPAMDANGGGGYRGRTVVDFEDDSIEGELEAPMGSYLMAKKESAAGKPAGGAAPTEPEGEPSSTTEATPAPATDRLVIYTGQMGVLVPSAERARLDFVAAVVAMGGWLQHQSDDTVTMRVPAARFQEAMDKAATYGPVTNRSVDAEDVTKQVFELSLRIENANRSRARLLELLAKAERTEDILKIENELRRLTEEIELLEGSLRTMRDRIAFSTLTVSFLSNAPSPTPYPQRRYSRFGWINQIGAENVMHSF